MHAWGVLFYYYGFLFHTGSIKSKRLISFQRGIPSFYSTLVRLKVDRLTIYTDPDTFLFHTGSIKSHSGGARCESVDEFLFHTGSIKRMLSAGLADAMIAVSIPHWFD